MFRGIQVSPHFALDPTAEGPTPATTSASNTVSAPTTPPPSTTPAPARAAVQSNGAALAYLTAQYRTGARSRPPMSPLAPAPPAVTAWMQRNRLSPTFVQSLCVYLQTNPVTGLDFTVVGHDAQLMDQIVAGMPQLGRALKGRLQKIIWPATALAAWNRVAFKADAAKLLIETGGMAWLMDLAVNRPPADMHKLIRSLAAARSQNLSLMVDALQAELGQCKTGRSHKILGVLHCLVALAEPLEHNDPAPLADLFPDLRDPFAAEDPPGPTAAYVTELLRETIALALQGSQAVAAMQLTLTPCVMDKKCPAALLIALHTNLTAMVAATENKNTAPAAFALLRACSVWQRCRASLFAACASSLARFVDFIGAAPHSADILTLLRLLMRDSPQRQQAICAALQTKLPHVVDFLQYDNIGAFIALGLLDEFAQITPAQEISVWAAIAPRLGNLNKFIANFATRPLSSRYALVLLYNLVGQNKERCATVLSAVELKHVLANLSTVANAPDALAFLLCVVSTDESHGDAVVAACCAQSQEFAATLENADTVELALRVLAAAVGNSASRATDVYALVATYLPSLTATGEACVQERLLQLLWILGSQAPQLRTSLLPLLGDMDLWNTPPYTAPLTVTQLADLSILQGEYHAAPLSTGGKEFYARYRSLVAAHAVTISVQTAPAAYPGDAVGTMDIPYVLYRPAAATAQNPRPLIMHTHGGPSVYMDPDKPHAEIAYFLSHGFVVAAPNYRGSTFPNGLGPARLRAWEKTSEGHHTLSGPQDVVIVTRHLLDAGYVLSDKVFLRGGSFGSHINAHLLAQVQQGIYPPLFAGAHLSGGLKYPLPSDMPHQFPLLLTHGAQDAIVEVETARLFMEKLLLTRRAADDGQVRTFIASHGGHHLINPNLKLGDEGPERAELIEYLQLMTNFFAVLQTQSRQQSIPVSKQLASLRATAWSGETLTPRTRAATSLQTWRDAPSLDAPPQLAAARRRVAPSPEMTTPKLLREHAVLAAKSSRAPQNHGLSSTAAHLRLVLGAAFRGDIAQDLQSFLRQHFKPIDWADRRVIQDAGQRIADDADFCGQIATVLQNEQRVLAAKPDHIVLYHTAPALSAQLYTTLTLWRSILRGDPCPTAHPDAELRLFDFITSSYDDVDVLLKAARRERLDDAETPFNHLPGFPDRVLACNVALTGNPHTDASSSLWWYFSATAAAGNHQPPTRQLLEQLFRSLGINSAARVQRYLDLFAQQEAHRRDAKSNQNLLQQIFVPYALARKYAYVCQVWGEEFGDNDLELHDPKIFQAMCHDPEALEMQLRARPQAFKNLGNLVGFGRTDDGFLYSNLLQVRLMITSLLQHPEGCETYSYSRDPAARSGFAKRLASLVQEDYADFLVRGTRLPDVAVAGAEIATLAARQKLGLPAGDAYADDLLVDIQTQMYRSQVQNARTEYKALWAGVSKEQKIRVQERCDDVRQSGSGRQPLYSLCIHLRGYTYDDLLAEAVEATSDAKSSRFLLGAIERFSSLEAGLCNPPTPHEYEVLCAGLESLRRHQFDSARHAFMRERASRPTARDPFAFELNAAIWIVRRSAYAALCWQSTDARLEAYERWSAHA